MSAVEYLLIDEPESHALLHASVVAGPAREYMVSLKPAEGASLVEQISLRFALHYYARVLYELARKDHSVRDLPLLVDRIASENMASRADLFELARVRGHVVFAVSESRSEVAVEFRRVGARDFQIDGHFRMTGRPLALSVIAVLQAIVVRLSPDGVSALLSALANMNVSYTLTHHYRDPRSLREVPTIAYHAASFV